MVRAVWLHLPGDALRLARQLQRVRSVRQPGTVSRVSAPLCPGRAHPAVLPVRQVPPLSARCGGEGDTVRVSPGLCLQVGARRLPGSDVGGRHGAGRRRRLRLLALLDARRRRLRSAAFMMKLRWRKPRTLTFVFVAGRADTPGPFMAQIVSRTREAGRYRFCCC